MKKIKWLLGMLLLALVPMLQSCDDDGYSIGDFSWDWATVRATGGGGYYLEGDNWGVIDPVAQPDQSPPNYHLPNNNLLHRLHEQSPSPS